MVRFIVWRFIQLLLASYLIVSILFIAVRVIPGDPAVVLLGARATQVEIANLREALGLNKPLVEQYRDFTLDVLRGQLGDSFFYKRPVTELVLERVPFTLSFAVMTMAWVIAVGLPLGILAALRVDSVVDYLVRLFVFVGQGMPDFWLAIMFILFFAVKLHWFPTFGVGTWKHLLLPTLALGMSRLPRVMRLSRAGMLDVLRQDYMRTARAKGLPYWVGIFRHGGRNLLIPLVTDTGLSFGWLLGGAVVIETVFALPGLGRLIVEAVQKRDYFLLQGVLFLFSFCFLLINLLIDVLYGYLDPRTRLTS